MKNEQFEILDTYDDFAAYWTRARNKSLMEQIRLWRTTYMKRYPELLTKQVQNYEKMNLDYREIAQRIFPSISTRLELMQTARDNILDVCGSICAKASEKLGLDTRVVFVIYVGIGSGAGWATKYGGEPAVLLGLENIAEEKWHVKDKLRGLISHEVGHLAHMKWRDEWENFERAEDEPLFQLYSEGFAQRCEHVILGRETWHMAQDPTWPSWCRRHKSWLAGTFLERLQKQESVRDFFGSWFNIQGRTQTGYFLGHEFILKLESCDTLRRIALYDREKVRKLASQYLESASNETAGR
jgi:hypothetical protein